MQLIATVIFACIAVVCLCNVASADLHHIKQMNDFLAFANDVANDKATYDVVLDTDLDFSSTTFPVPVGVDSQYECHFYSRDFNGQGHTIKNLKMKSSTYGDAALFCGLNDYSVKNLVIDKSCEFSGSIAGGLAVMANNPDIGNVTVNAQVTGEVLAGGFIGAISATIEAKNPITNINKCQNNAIIKVTSGLNSCAGGFIGSIKCNSPTGYCSLNMEHNSGDVNVQCLSPETILGGVVGAVEDSKNIFVNLNGNTLSVTSHSAKCETLTSGGAIGIFEKSPGFSLKMQGNVFYQSDKSD